MFPAWSGKLFVSSLLSRYLVRLVLDGSRVVAEERLLADLHVRIRGGHEGPDARCTCSRTARMARSFGS